MTTFRISWRAASSERTFGGQSRLGWWSVLAAHFPCTGVAGLVGGFGVAVFGLSWRAALAAQFLAGSLCSQRCGHSSSFLMGGLVGAIFDWVDGCPSWQTFCLDCGQAGKCITKHFWWATAGLAGCLVGALLVEFIRVLRGALFGWIAGDLGGALKAYLLVGGLGACGRLWRPTCRHGWRAALAALFLAGSVGVLRGAYFG